MCQVDLVYPMRLPSFSLTLVIGPDVGMPFLPSPDMEEVGEAAGALDLKGVMDWDTPEARVNCSLSSTLVRPLAGKGWSGLARGSIMAHTILSQEQGSTTKAAAG